MKVGAQTSADIVNEANKLFPNGNPSKDRAERWKQLEAIPEEAFEHLDIRFVDENDDYIYELVYRFWTTSSE